VSIMIEITIASTLFSNARELLYDLVLKEFHIISVGHSTRAWRRREVNGRRDGIHGCSWMADRGVAHRRPTGPTMVRFDRLP
jgi:hypothetical protein